MKKKLLFSALISVLAIAHAETEVPVSTSNPLSTQNSEITPPPQPIDCQYHIAPKTSTVENSVITTWSQNAAVQSFDFSPTSFDMQLEKLKPCFTEQGWEGFNDALQKSGNINAIKNQNLNVSSQVDGEVKLTPIKENQWKLNVPLQVVYQNNTEKLTQLLSVDLLVGRKTSGDLGIMQIIATPRNPTPTNSAGLSGTPAEVTTMSGTNPVPTQPAPVQ
jgi:hypothetical protein